MKKVFITILIIVILLVCNSTVIYAESSGTAGDIEPDSNWLETAKRWIELGREGRKSTESEWGGFNDLAGILWGAGIFVILIIGSVLGIKYMFASVEEKASIKETLKPFIVGSVIILGAFGIWKFLVEFLDGVL